MSDKIWKDYYGMMTLDEVDEIDNVEIGIKDGRYQRSNG